MLALVIAAMHAETVVSSRPLFLLSLAFHPKQSIYQRAQILDKNDWILPKKRLERFRRAGFTINEERHVVVTAWTTVESVTSDAAKLSSLVRVRSYDVRRNIESDDQENVSVEVTANNHRLGGGLRLEEAEAAMEDLPTHPVGIGSSWTTRERVSTELGSGSALFHHRIAAVDGDVVEIAVSARGSITGAEYDLPKLLPGTIELIGMAWFDRKTRGFFHESYAIHNAIVKPAEHERIGFDNTQWVDVTSVTVRGTVP